MKITIFIIETLLFSVIAPFENKSLLKKLKKREHLH